MFIFRKQKKDRIYSIFFVLGAIFMISCYNEKKTSPLGQSFSALQSAEFLKVYPRWSSTNAYKTSRGAMLPLDISYEHSLSEKRFFQMNSISFRFKGGKVFKVIKGRNLRALNKKETFSNNEMKTIFLPLPLFSGRSLEIIVSGHSFLWEAKEYNAKKRTSLDLQSKKEFIIPARKKILLLKKSSKVISSIMEIQLASIHQLPTVKMTSPLSRVDNAVLQKQMQYKKIIEENLQTKWKNLSDQAKVKEMAKLKDEIFNN